MFGLNKTENLRVLIALVISFIRMPTPFAKFSRHAAWWKIAYKRRRRQYSLLVGFLRKKSYCRKEFLGFDMNSPIWRGWVNLKMVEIVLLKELSSPRVILSEIILYIYICNGAL